jgi:hypothetical protein
MTKVEQVGTAESDNGQVVKQSHNRLADTTSAPDPFDLDSLRLRGDVVDNVRKVLTVIPCRKPANHEWVRVRPGIEYELDTCIYEDKASQTTYIVPPNVRAEFADCLVRNVRLHLATTRQGDVFLWPVKLPRADGRTNSWNESAAGAANMAKTKWTRMASNMSAGMYDVWEAPGDFGEPEWPDLTLQGAIKLAFRDRLIDDPDHAVLQGLRGEI